MNRHLTPGCKTVILINGIPASGKSTVTRQLSAAFNASRLQDRKPGHPGEEYLPELAQLAQQAEPMRLGPVFTVDQHKPLDMASATRWIETQIA